MLLSIDSINKLYRCGLNVSAVGCSMVVFMISSYRLVVDDSYRLVDVVHV
jgi:hypothetical protein